MIIIINKKNEEDDDDDDSWTERIRIIMMIVQRRVSGVNKRKYWDRMDMDKISSGLFMGLQSAYSKNRSLPFSTVNLFEKLADLRPQIAGYMACGDLLAVQW